MKTLTKDQLSRLRALANRINTSSKADFVKRLLDEKRAVLKNGDGTVSTHEMSWADDGKGNAVVFPMVQRTPDGLQRFGGWSAYDRAVQNGDTLHMSVPDATLYTENYKQVYPGFDQYAAGGDIHIKPENRGKFTALKERTGHSASWFKAHGTPAQKKMAVFALNARKWNHAQGGLLRRFEDGSPGALYDPEGVLAVPSQETAASVQEPVVSVPDISYPGDVRIVRGGSALPADFSFTPQRVSAPVESVAVVSEPVAAIADRMSVEVPAVLPFESRAAEAAVLGENASGLVSRQVNALKSGEDLKAFQKELLEKGYYRNLPSPQITARTRDEVEALQRKLKAAGYDLGNYGVNGDGIDGRLGRKTRAAWAQYVKDHPEEALLDTVADGKLGPQTRAAARRYYQDIADGARAAIAEASAAEQMTEPTDDTSPAEVETDVQSLSFPQYLYQTGAQDPTNLLTVGANLVGGFLFPRSGNSFLNEGARRQMVGAALQHHQDYGNYGIDDRDHIKLGGMTSHSGDEFRQDSGFTDYLGQMAVSPYHNIYGESSYVSGSGERFEPVGDSYNFKNTWEGKDMIEKKKAGEGRASLAESIGILKKTLESGATLKAAIETAATYRGVDRKPGSTAKVSEKEMDKLRKEYERYLTDEKFRKKIDRKLSEGNTETLRNNLRSIFPHGIMLGVNGPGTIL